MKTLDMNQMEQIEGGDKYLSCLAAGIGVGAIIFNPTLAPALGGYTTAAAAACIAQS